MKQVQHLKWEDYQQELLQDPAFREALKEVELEYQITRAMMKARIEKGLTKEKLAKKLHTTPAVISRVESGKVLPSIPFLKRLAAALHTSFRVEFGGV